MLNSDELGNFERVGRYLPNNTELECAKEFLEYVPEKYVEGRTPPRFVTDRAVAVGRNKDFNRQILHYVQPHAPYLANAVSEKRLLKEHEENPFDYIQKTGDRESVWNTYLDELRWVLDDIGLLLDNIEAEKVVISADHGEAFGEYGVYSHYTGSLHPHIRYVPWATTSATDSKSYQPKVEPKESDTVSTEKNLKALGYL